MRFMMFMYPEIEEKDWLGGEADVAGHPRQAGDQPRRLDPPDGLDRPAGLGAAHVCSGGLSESCPAACTSSGKSSIS